MMYILIVRLQLQLVKLLQATSCSQQLLFIKIDAFIYSNEHLFISFFFNMERKAVLNVDFGTKLLVLLKYVTLIAQFMLSILT